MEYEGKRSRERFDKGNDRDAGNRKRRFCRSGCHQPDFRGNLTGPDTQGRMSPRFGVMTVGMMPRTMEKETGG